jgi:hypothetical protein
MVREGQLRGDYFMFKKLLLLFVLTAWAYFPFHAIDAPSASPEYPILLPAAIATVPEPSTIALFGLGVVGIIGFARRRQS